MGVNLEWEVCESGGAAGEEWAGATMPSSAELLLPAQRGFLCWEHLSGAQRVLEGERECWEKGLHPGALA